MLSFPVRLGMDDAGMVVLTFPDLPEATVSAASEGEAFAGAQEALEKTLASYVVEGRSIPAPSDVCGAPMVTTEQFSLLGLELNPGARSP